MNRPTFKLLLKRITAQLSKSYFGQSGFMLNSITLPPNVSTVTLDAQSAFVLAVPSKVAEEPLLETEEKENVS